MVLVGTPLQVDLVIYQNLSQTLERWIESKILFRGGQRVTITRLTQNLTIEDNRVEWKKIDKLVNFHENIEKLITVVAQP